MTVFFLGLSLLAFAPALVGAKSSDRPKNGCLKCHGKEAKQFAKSVHADADIGCDTCHGGDPSRYTKKEAHTPLKGFKGVPKHQEIPELCGSCHSDTEMMRQYALPTDQLDQYKKSNHGKRLYANNDPNVATCVDCHGGHAVLGLHDPNSTIYPLNVIKTCGHCHSDEKIMKPYNLPSDTAERYSESVHGTRLLKNRDIGAPTCATCHGSHGAAPPGAKEVVHVCGNCHSSVQAYFKKSPHYSAAEEGLMEECTSCHSNHANERAAPGMFEGDEDGHCGGCHDDKERLEVGAQLHGALNELEKRIEESEAEIAHTRKQGIFVDDEAGMIRDARRVLVSAGPVTHAVNLNVLNNHLRTGQASIEELNERLEVKRRGIRDMRIITTIAVLVFLAFIGLLYVKWRLMVGKAR